MLRRIFVQLLNRRPAIDELQYNQQEILHAPYFLTKVCQEFGVTWIELGLWLWIDDYSSIKSTSAKHYSGLHMTILVQYRLCKRIEREMRRRRRRIEWCSIPKGPGLVYP